ncbi:glucuronyl hydrolase, putative [Bacillus sp. NRRL B-14911]|uniref:Glucuronyl hydrolase n=1 Tax=Bacillus infantis NRRL B-14911 TaxID=1367477 RepID=U5LIB4_9BACI|nr:MULTISPECIES: glycoside hydrolase family 88 protein [Bacillus]AGX06367.1 glucuronyl hydrolase [Bacillus infantis NRRL B-14911]EAR68706.1 glucuronyl hydrolase, putative [Bacillus sp. NRRL B-14911]
MNIFGNDVKREAIKNKDRFVKMPAVDRAFAERAIEHVLAKIDQSLEAFTDKFPDSSSVGLIYKPIDNVEWTTSFWTGMLWLAYEYTGQEKYKKVAEKHICSFKDRLENRIEVDHHDLGFLYSLSCVSAFKVTGNENAKETALKAAELLASRYSRKAGIIQAWGDLNDPAQRGRMIIDCNMNLPLLYWASDTGGNCVYKEIAKSHVKKAAQYLVRNDASTFHTYYMDVDSGKPLYGNTHQGHSDDSCWARGQAWGIYGFALSYYYTGDWSLIELSKNLANYYLNRLPEDQICYWDLCFTEGEEERDSSAAAITVSGLLELSRHLPVTDPAKTIYGHAALRMIQSLYENYTTEVESEANGVLKHAVYHKGGSRGVNESCIWGDYYYFEALVRCVKDWKMYW